MNSITLFSVTTLYERTHTCPHSSYTIYKIGLPVKPDNCTYVDGCRNKNATYAAQIVFNIYTALKLSFEEEEGRR